MEAQKKKRGRPIKMTEAVKKKAIHLIATSTKTIKEVCKVLKIAESTFNLTLSTDVEFSVQYGRAKEQQADLLFEDIINIARRKSKDSVAATDKRTEIDAMKWIIAKRMPKKYGDRTQVQLQGQDPTEPPAPIIIQSTSDINLNSVPTEVLEALLASQQNEHK